MSYCTIEVYTHFIKITKIQATAHRALMSVLSDLVQYKYRKTRRGMVKEKDRCYAARSLDRSEYRLSIGSYPVFLQELKRMGIKENQYTVKEMPLDLGVDIDVPFKEGWIPREVQVPVIDWILEEGHIKTSTLQMGDGKTASSLYAAHKYGKRVLITVLGRFYDKWVGDVFENYEGIEVDRVICARGSKQLMLISDMLMRGEELDFDVILITTKTVQDYVRLYKESLEVKSGAYLMPPEEIWQQLGIGFKITDEVHMHYHANFISELYTHVGKSVYLSATLVNEDEFIDKMYNLLCPASGRRGGEVYRKYAKATCYMYKLGNTRGLKFLNAQQQYSQDVYEQWIRKSKPTNVNYLNMIQELVEKEFMAVKLDGQRCLIFAYGVDMCRDIRDHLRKAYPHLTISKYNAEDPYEDLMESDITVSTIGSSGTGVDISNLLTCIMTTALSGMQANIQALGRLRELKTDQVPHFIYLTCRNIDRHTTYHEKKSILFRARTVEQNEVYHDKVV